MTFDLERAVHEIFTNFSSDKIFVDRVISRMFFSGLQVTQQVTSDRFGTGVGLFGNNAGNGRGLILLSPLGIQNASFLPNPPIEMLKLARLDLLTKIWVAERLMEALNPPKLMIAAYRMDPLGDGFSTLFNDIIRPNCDKSTTAVLFSPDANKPFKIMFRPAVVNIHMPITRTSVNKGRSFTVTISNRTRIDWTTLLEKLSTLNKMQGTVLSDITFGGWDRNQLRFAAFTVTTDSKTPDWPGQWRTRVLKTDNPLKGGLNDSLHKIKRCLQAFGISDITPIFLQTQYGFLDCTYMMPPQMVADFVSSVKKNGAQTERIELYDSESAKPDKIWKKTPGVISMLQPFVTYIASPPISLARDPMQGLNKWALNLSDFLKRL